MKKIYLLVITIYLVSCVDLSNNENLKQNAKLQKLFNDYHEESLKLYPISATYEGDNRYNDLLIADFTESNRIKYKQFYEKYLSLLNSFQKSELNETDKLSYEIFNDQLNTAIEGFNFNDNYFPFNQFVGLQLTMVQLASGSGAQPFKTIADYNNWIKRVNAFSLWADSAIMYFKLGIEKKYVLPKSIVLKMIPQLEEIVVSDPTKSIFYGPIINMPKSFSGIDKKQLTEKYIQLIKEQVNPTYKKLAEFIKTTYLPVARNTSGINDIPNGEKYYTYLVKSSTTTNKSPEEIYNLGLLEVKRIKTLMEEIKDKVGFKGTLAAFFEYLKNDKKFMPYKTPQEVIAAFHKIHKTMQPQLKKYFNMVPKTPFEIRQTEAFRAASASAEYNQGSADGTRPGIFYVPIVDATKFNTTSGMESLFLHEAIPGHHYQISIQQEDTMLPGFRRFGGYNAFCEGWALYCESLGKELGLYTDPYQYMGALGDEMHRAIRLVVDVAIHTKNLSREDAIKYMMENEPISEQGATAEIERYMVIPSQALGYKIGALKIKELREKYQTQLKTKFNIADFHDQILKDGSMPLTILENKLATWASKK